MQNKKDRKEVVITGATVTKWTSVLTIVAVVVATIVMLVRGTPFVEIFTDYWWMYVGLFVAVGGAFWGDGKKNKNHS